MSLSLEFRKTSDLTEGDRLQICRLFAQVFGKPKTLAQFTHQFADTVLGYSFHGLLRDGDAIVGVCSHVPLEYRCRDRRHLFALSVDSMIAAEHRGHPAHMIRMTRAVREAEVAAGIPFVFGFPNDVAFVICTKALGWREIGTLDYFFLPIRPGSFDRRLLPAEIVTRAASWLMNLSPRRARAAGGGRSAEPAAVEKVDSARFRSYRYTLFPVDYQIVPLGSEGYYSYLLKPHHPIHPALERMKVAYLLDVHPMGKEAFEEAVRQILRRERGLDLAVFVGRLGFTPRNMFRLPKRREPRAFRMAGAVLIDGVLEQDALFDIARWNVNLSDFDLL